MATDKKARENLEKLVSAAMKGGLSRKEAIDVVLATLREVVGADGKKERIIH